MASKGSDKLPLLLLIGGGAVAAYLIWQNLSGSSTTGNAAGASGASNTIGGSGSNAGGNTTGNNSALQNLIDQLANQNEQAPPSGAITTPAATMSQQSSTSNLAQDVADYLNNYIGGGNPNNASQIYVAPSSNVVALSQGEAASAGAGQAINTLISQLGQVGLGYQSVIPSAQYPTGGIALQMPSSVGGSGAVSSPIQMSSNGGSGGSGDSFFIASGTPAPSGATYVAVKQNSSGQFVPQVPSNPTVSNAVSTASLASRMARGL
jgi:hypothetical protein